MRAGKLDKIITIERSASVIDEFGTPQQTWAPLATVRAEIKSLTLEEFARAYGASSEAVVAFRIRWLPDLTIADRISHGGIIFDLKEIKAFGRREGLELRCVARP